MILAALAAAMQTAPAPPPPPDAPKLKACAEIDPGSPFIAFERQLVRVGDTIRIKPMVGHAWFGDEEVRWDCFDHWSVSDAKAARIDAVRGVLVIAADAPPDSDITVSAVFRKTLSVERGPVRAGLRIAARAAEVLTGTWREVKRTDCDGDTIGELIFGPTGRYSFTFSAMMIETMTSGGGAFSWDPNSMALEMMGRRGVARLSDFRDAKGPEHDALIIAGIDFHPRAPPALRPDGTPSPGRPPCTVVFARVS